MGRFWKRECHDNVQAIQRRLAVKNQPKRPQAISEVLSEVRMTTKSEYSYLEEDLMDYTFMRARHSKTFDQKEAPKLNSLNPDLVCRGT